MLCSSKVRVFLRNYRSASGVIGLTKLHAGAGLENVEYFLLAVLLVFRCEFFFGVRCVECSERSQTFVSVSVFDFGAGLPKKKKFIPSCEFRDNLPAARAVISSSSSRRVLSRLS